MKPNLIKDKNADYEFMPNNMYLYVYIHIHVHVHVHVYTCTL